MMMLQHFRFDYYFRPGVTTVSLITVRPAVVRSMTGTTDGPISTSRMGSACTPALRLFGLSWIKSSWRGGMLPAHLSDCNWPRNGYASGPTPSPDSDYEVPP